MTEPGIAMPGADQQVYDSSLRRAVATSSFGKSGDRMNELIRAGTAALS